MELLICAALAATFVLARKEWLRWLGPTMPDPWSSYPEGSDDWAF